MQGFPKQQEIFCPKCGSSITMTKIKDLRTRAQLQGKGYILGYEGGCECGVKAIFALKKMPENPTFTLFWNIYKLEPKKRKKS
ncbi:MAG: hypothetical protein KKD44_26015 [Proteobacteria bacterium]|nr:hypothetical protein [Pseudomonadota bacterium]